MKNKKRERKTITNTFEIRRDIFEINKYNEKKKKKWNETKHFECDRKHTVWAYEREQ